MFLFVCSLLIVFQGSVFVTFASKDDSDKFLKTEGLKHKDTDENELKKMLK